MTETVIKYQNSINQIIEYKKIKKEKIIKLIERLDEVQGYKNTKNFAKLIFDINKSFENEKRKIINTGKYRNINKLFNFNKKRNEILCKKIKQIQIKLRINEKEIQQLIKKIKNENFCIENEDLLRETMNSIKNKNENLQKILHENERLNQELKQYEIEQKQIELYFKKINIKSDDKIKMIVESWYKKIKYTIKNEKSLKKKIQKECRGIEYKINSNLLKFSENCGYDAYEKKSKKNSNFYELSNNCTYEIFEINSKHTNPNEIFKTSIFEIIKTKSKINIYEIIIIIIILIIIILDSI